MTQRVSTSRRGFVLVTVLIVVVIAALIGTTMLQVAGAESESSQRSLELMQSRSLAWSGVQAVMSELSSQRETMLDGIEPTITDEWTVFEGANGTRGVFRVVAIGDDPSRPMVSETGKLNLNTATEEMLAAHPLVGRDLAEQIVSRRGSSPFGSVEELLELDGVTQEMMFGPDDPDATRVGFEEPSQALKDVLTVFSFDPNVQAGIGRDGRSHRGDLRVNLNVEWSDRLGRAIAKRWGDDAANGVEALKKQNVDMSSLGAFCGFLKNLDIEDDLWIGVLDSITTTNDMYIPGLIDINNARADVLACIPGIDADAADEIVDARDSLDEQTLQSVYWPVQEGILDLDHFVQAVDFLTTRTMQWRVRVEAGMVADIDSLAGLGPKGSGDGHIGGLLPEEPRLEHRIVVESVIDVSSQRPRVAYMRDVTLLETAQRWATAVGTTDEQNPLEESGLMDPAEGPLAGSDPTESGQPRLERPTLERPSLDRPTRERTRLSDQDRRRDRSSVSPRSADAAVGVSSGAGSASSEEPVDRRIGRWTPRAGGGS